MHKGTLSGVLFALIVNKNSPQSIFFALAPLLMLLTNIRYVCTLSKILITILDYHIFKIGKPVLKIGDNCICGVPEKHCGAGKQGNILSGWHSFAGDQCQ